MARSATGTSVPVALTIAGSDSGGGAGVQADLKAFAALGVFGTSALTCVTAQNPDEVTGVEAIDVDIVRQQIEAVCSGFLVRAAKTGMLYSREIIHAVAEAWSERRDVPLVVDPVMVATSGAGLLREDAVEALRAELIPLATVLTPNLPEAEILLGRRIRTADELRDAALRIGEKYGVACVAKGGHLGTADCRSPIADRRGEETTDGGACGTATVLDVLFADGEVHAFTSPRVDARETHGTGCTFSAALTALLARGESLVGAARGAQRFVVGALAGALRVGDHYPLRMPDAS